MTDIKINKMCIHRKEVPVAFRQGKWEYDIQTNPVKVLAICGIWAMVRNKGCAPYVARVKELLPLTEG